MRAVTNRLPSYGYEFYGDTAHLPYGDKTEEEIYELTRAGVEHLFKRDCVLVIIACNTASAETLRRLQDTFLAAHYPNRRILGVIIPTVETVVASDVSRVLLIGTQRTVNSGKYERELAKFEGAPVLQAVATPGLVPLIEAGRHEEALASALSVIESFVATGQGKANGLVLGCTHYTTLQQDIQARFPELHIFSQDTIIPEKLADYLERHPLLRQRVEQSGVRNIHLTQQRPEYDRIIAQLLGGTLIPLE